MILTPETLPSPIRKKPDMAKVTASFIGLRFTKAAALMMGIKKNNRLHVAVHIEGDKIAIETVNNAYPVKSYNHGTTFTVANRTLGEFIKKHFNQEKPSFTMKKITSTLFQLQLIEQ